MNTELIDLPRELGAFVVVHQLTPNHGKVFKSFMHAYLLDWEVLEQRLQKIGCSSEVLP